jgi:hypothetical protein
MSEQKVLDVAASSHSNGHFHFLLGTTRVARIVEQRYRFYDAL